MILLFLFCVIFYPYFYFRFLGFDPAFLLLSPVLFCFVYPLTFFVEGEFSTEREGFEPSTEVASCNSLAGSRFQPLSHLSSSLTIVPRGLPTAQITKRGKRCLKLQSTSQGIESASSAQDLGLMVCSPSRPSRVTTSPLSKLLCSVASRIS